MAVLNLFAGVMIASWPERQSDLETMQRWGKEWLAGGADPYAIPGEAPDYPPHAIVALSPLGVLPVRFVVPAWALLNVGLAVLAPFLAVRAVRPTATLSEATLPVLMFLCWGGARTLLQFSLVTLSLSLVAMVLADKRPAWSGVSLGLALIKPQMALPVLLWALLTRRWRVVCIAWALVTAGFALFCLRAHATPASVVAPYVAILRLLYLGDSRVVGLANLRQVLALAISSTPAVDALSITLAMALLAAICVLGLREGQRRNAVRYGAPPLVGIWSLMTFYHLTYGFIVLLSTATTLIFANDADTLSFRKRVFWVLQLALMVDVPGMWRRFGHFLAVPDAIGAALMHFDRLLMLVLFACVAALATRARNAPCVHA